MTRRVALPCGCAQDPGLGAQRDKLCKCGNLFVKVGAAKKPPRKPLKQGRGFAVTQAQRKKTMGLPCVGCGEADTFEIEAGHTDPAHLWPRGLGGCDSPDCVIPLCRTCHRRLDDPSDAFDLLPALVDRGYWTELAHPILCHEVSLTPLLERVTGREWTSLELAGVSTDAA